MYILVFVSLFLLRNFGIYLSISETYILDVMSFSNTPLKIQEWIYLEAKKIVCFLQNMASYSSYTI